MTPSEMPAHVQMMNFASAKFISKPLWVAAQLGIADLIAQGVTSTDELAQRTGTHERSLYRILRALACVGIFTESAPRQFDLTPLASTLKSDAPNSMRDAVIFLNHPVHDIAWTEILHSVKTGLPALRSGVRHARVRVFSEESGNLRDIQSGHDEPGPERHRRGRRQL